AGQQRLRLQQRQGLQVPAEGVHQAVQRLVRHGLLLVATARQHDRLAALRQPVEETLDQRRLAYTGAAVNVKPYGPSLPASVEPGCQGLEVQRTADHGNFRGRCYPGCRGRGAFRRLGAEPAEDVVPGRALPRIAAQQVPAERAEVVRDFLDEAGGVRRVEVL